MRLSNYFFIFFVLALVASTPTEASEFDKKPTYSGVILFIGDSTMAAYTAPKERPSLLVSKRLSVSVDNLGEGGTGTTDMMKTLDATLRQSGAKIVVANYAINDAGFISEAKYRDNLSYFVRAVRASGKIPVLEEPNPVCNAQDASDRLDRYVSVIRGVSAEFKVPLIRQYDEIKQLKGWQSMTIDCIHPKGELYKFKAQNEITHLRRILKKAGHYSGSGKPASMKAGSDL